jgi:hypothetical protein
MEKKEEEAPARVQIVLAKGVVVNVPTSAPLRARVVAPVPA